MLKTFQPTTSQQNASNNQNNKNSSYQFKPTLPPMTTKSIIKSGWANIPPGFRHNKNKKT